MEKQQIIAESAYEVKETDEQQPSRPKFTLHFDELVISVGGVPNTFGVPGMKVFNNLMFMLMWIYHIQ